jgi:hypothetical protein
MNFLNDSLKTLKNVLAEGLDQKVDFDGSPAELEEEEARSASGQNDKLRKLCQHQAEEVSRSVFVIALFFATSCCAHDISSQFHNNKKDSFRQSPSEGFFAS